MRNVIFVVGVGTGGHLFPAVALGEAMATRGYEAHLITDTRCQKYLGKDIDLPVHILSLGSIRSSITTKLLTMIRIFIACLYSIYLIIRHKPLVVVGFGGYTTFPTLLVAKILGINIVIHEQNCFLGKVNKFFFNVASKVALNFAETTNLPNVSDSKIVITGNLVRKAISSLNPTRRFDDVDFRILVIGGSQGAKVFATIVPDALKIVRAKLPDIKLSITQQASSVDKPILEGFYQAINVDAVIAPFFHDMPQKYTSSHLTICRAGASTISELIYLGQPAILIPFPFAAEDHQTFNAKALCSKNVAWSFQQSTLTPEMLAVKIMKLIEDRAELQMVSEQLLGMRKDSVKMLSDIVEVSYTTK